jgi:hypothetical protein
MRFRGSSFLCLAFAAFGCGGPANVKPTVDDMKQTALSEVGELYRMYTFEKKKAPTKVADFVPLEPMSPTGLRAIQDGEVVVRFGAAMKDTEEGPAKTSSDEVLAYEKQVPESGGRVLMLDRTIRSMVPEEFKSAKLAGTSSSDQRAPKKS